MAQERNNRGNTELTERFEVLMTPDLRRGLELLGRRHGVSASAIVRMLAIDALVHHYGHDWRKQVAMEDEPEVDIRTALVQREPHP